MKTIYLDMDGTIADLYSVDNWVSKLNVGDSTPYSISDPLVDLKKLENLLVRLKEKGYKIGIVSWGSKRSDEKFLEEVREAKRKWVVENLPNVKFDEFAVIDYSCNKAVAVKDPFGILFDDSSFVRQAWPGESHSQKEIFDVLSKLLER
jgi:5'(3')-deoxyribonucleotidase